MLVVGAAVFAEGESVAPRIQLDTKTLFYPNAKLPNAIHQYKAGNITGCLQEGLSVIIKEPNNPVAHYYVGLSLAKAGYAAQSSEYLDKAASLSGNPVFARYAMDAKDCIIGAESCQETQEEAELSRFIKDPNSSISPALEQERRRKELELMKKQMNNDKFLNLKFDDNRLAMASDEEILQAIRTLKESGVSVTVNMAPNYHDPQWEQMSQMQMFSGGGNNNNSGANAAMSLLPMIMNAEQSGKNIDPQVIQAIMMQSMMPDFGNFGFNNNK
jgi:hypothetical protein